VIRKLSEELSEEEEHLKEQLEKIEAKLEPELNLFLAEKSALVISKEFYTSWVSANMMVLTVPQIKKPDGSIILKGHFDELQPPVTNPGGVDKAYTEFLENIASSKPYEGREAHMTQMQTWLQQEEQTIKEYFASQSGKLGKLLIKLQPILSLYPKLLKKWALFKEDAPGQMMKIFNAIKTKILKLLKREEDALKEKVSEVEAKAKDAVGKVEAKAKDAVGKVEAEAKEAVGKAKDAVGKVEAEAKEAAGKVEAEAKDAVEKVKDEVGEVEAKVGEAEAAAAPTLMLRRRCLTKPWPRPRLMALPPQTCRLPCWLPAPALRARTKIRSRALLQLLQKKTMKHQQR